MEASDPDSILGPTFCTFHIAAQFFVRKHSCQRGRVSVGRCLAVVLAAALSEDCSMCDNAKRPSSALLTVCIGSFTGARGCFVAFVRLHSNVADSQAAGWQHEWQTNLHDFRCQSFRAFGPPMGVRAIPIVLHGRGSNRHAASLQ